MNIADEIQQSEFESDYQKAAINLLFTSSWLSGIQNRSLKPYGISWQQFNIMRIVRGQDPTAVCVADIKTRMIDRMSNVSRLVDKLYQKELVTRTTSPHDRRMVDITLTPKGHELLNQLDKRMEEMSEEMRFLSQEEYEMLNTLLDKFRG